MADFCLLRRGRAPKLIKFYVKPLVNFSMDSMVPTVPAGKASYEEVPFLYIIYASFQEIHIASRMLVIETFMCTKQNTVVYRAESI